MLLESLVNIVNLIVGINKFNDLSFGFFKFPFTGLIITCPIKLSL